MVCKNTAMVEHSVYDEDAPRLVRVLGRRPTEVNLNLVWDYPVFWSKYTELGRSPLPSHPTLPGMQESPS
jgi:hypothetical protein